jgi:hypothetical protein
MPRNARQSFGNSRFPPPSARFGFFAPRFAVWFGLLALGSSVQAQNNGMQAQIPAAEYDALVDLYNSAGGAGWYQNTSWLDPQATWWQGVDVENTQYDLDGNVVIKGYVQSIVLLDNKLSGTLPDSLGNFSQLTSLDLGHNTLAGNIPASLGNLSQLAHLSLAGNQFSGPIPPSLGGLAQLQYLDLSANNLGGSIPPGLGDLSQLQHLYLDFNELTGSIPPSLGDLRQLEDLYLYNNQLGGGAPDFAAFTNVFIDIASNYLDVATGSASLANIGALIQAGNTVIYAPQAGLAVPALLSISLLSGGAARVGVSGSSGQSYTIQSSTDLSSWTSLANLALTNSSEIFLDPAATNQSRRFYRAVATP